VTIRAATAADVATIAQLIRDLADYERLTHELAIDERRMGEHLSATPPLAEVLLAEDDSGTAVGFAFFLPGYSTFASQPAIYLEDIFVRPQARGAGHGRDLIAALARIAVERGCARIEFRVLDWNESAQRFYRALGAEPLGDWTPWRISGDALRALAERSTK